MAWTSKARLQTPGLACRRKSCLDGSRFAPPKMQNRSEMRTRLEFPTQFAALYHMALSAS
jgi:hypothetical protein